ncbi:MAG: hypothetical protein GY703_13090 [Gammaproteobacteria bacterium]|nr:hypothetical protein [Gammaproteobacteria bacterium]
MPKKKQPTLTSQIAELTERKGKLQRGVGMVKNSLTTHQERLDKAEEHLVDCITTQMGDDTPENREAVSEARVAKGVITNQYDQHQHELKLIPEAIKKVNEKIRALESEKKVREHEIITANLPDIEPLRENARDAIGKLAAVMCMESTRNVNFLDVKLAIAKLDNDKSVTCEFIRQFDALNAQMGFEAI